MSDNNYLATPQSLASTGSPIVINNACTSLHRLAQAFMFANARAYIGTLVTVLDVEAQEIIQRLFGQYIDETLPTALWMAQNDVAGDGVRRPYVVIGCHFQKIRPTGGDHISHALKVVAAALDDWKSRLTANSTLTDKAKRSIANTINSLEADSKALQQFADKQESGYRNE